MKRVFILIWWSLLFSSCIKYDYPIVDKSLSVADTLLTFWANGGEKLLTGTEKEGSLMANSITIDEQTVQDDGDSKTPLVNLWCSVTYDAESRGIVISLLPNYTGKERKCTIFCSNSSHSKFGSVTIQQSQLMSLCTGDGDW